MNGEARLDVEGLHLWRGDRHVLRGVSFSAASGTCLQVRGQNGAGKTTLLRAVCGLLEIEAGQVLWNGESARGGRAEFHGAMSYLGHDLGLKPDLSATENLRFAVGIRRHVTTAEIRDGLERVGIAALADRAVRRMSAGQKRRVALARVCLQQSRLWILDEPTSNLDTAGQKLVIDLIDAHTGAGGIALVATHYPMELHAGRLESLELAA